MDKLGLIKLTLDGTKTIASRFFYSPPPSEKILDPMSTIVRLAILSYYPVNTKLSIHNNSLYLQEPSYVQATLRWGSGDDRSDLHNLHNPISKALDWYDLKLPYVSHIFRLAREGLNLLIDCYKGSNESNLVCHSLNYYSKLIDLKLKSANPQQIRPSTAPAASTASAASATTEEQTQTLDLTLAQSTTSIESPPVVIEDAFASLDTNIYNHTGITKLKEYWSYNELKLISEIFKVVDEYKLKGEQLTYILGSINKIVQGKDVKVQDLIIKLTTTLTQ